MNKLTKLLSISILFLALTLGLALAQTDTAVFQATIVATNSAEIDISPNSFTFNGPPGAGLKDPVNSAEIENIGSTNVSQISLDVTVGNSNPWATGYATNYAVGAYLQASIDNISFFYINYQDWNRTAPVYVINPTNTVASGRFVVEDGGGFFWAVQNGNGSSTNPAQCNNGTLFLANASVEMHNKTNTGGADLTIKIGRALTSTITTGAVNSTNNNAWGLIDVVLTNYGGTAIPLCFAIAGNCSEIRLFRWNKASYPYDNVSACNNDIFFYDNTDGFKPGSFIRLYFALELPFGIANGTITSSTVTVRATD